MPRRIPRRARDGILITETEERTNWTYKVRSEAATPSTLIIEHPARGGWKLADGQTPAESTPQAHRFRVIVDPGKEAKLAVREVMAGTSRLAVGDVTPQLIVQLTASGLPAGRARTRTEARARRKTEIAAVERRFETSSQRNDRPGPGAAPREHEGAARKRGGKGAPAALHAPVERTGEPAGIAAAGNRKSRPSNVTLRRNGVGGAIASLSFEIGQ